jgi:hypothetical protein
MTTPLALGNLLIVIGLLIQGFGCSRLPRFLYRHHADADEELLPHGALPPVIRNARGLFLPHWISILVRTPAYPSLTRVRPIQSLEAAVHFSVVTLAAFGGRDIAKSAGQWWLLTGIEAPKGLLLLDWSTARLFALAHRSRGSHARCRREDGTWRAAQWPRLLERRDVQVTHQVSVP